MNILIIDLETTGLTPDTHKVIEVGAILFCCDNHTVLQQLSFLIPCEDNPQFKTNKIKAEASQLNAIYTGAIDCFLQMESVADYITAYNSDFDSKWFGHPNQELPPTTKPWFDSMLVDWPRASKPRQSLVSLALDHSIAVTSAHRALTDCQLLAELYRRCRDVPSLIQGALEPLLMAKASVSYDDRQLAKDAGFVWDKIIKGSWARKVKQSEIASFPFAVEIIQEN